MIWFIVYVTVNTCISNLQMGCGGTYSAEMIVPSREICEQIVKDNSNQDLKCWAKPVLKNEK